MPKHWLLGEETHFGRGYFSLQRFDSKRAAVVYAREEYGLRHAEEQVLCIALELVGCDCTRPEVHDG